MPVANTDTLCRIFIAMRSVDYVDVETILHIRISSGGIPVEYAYMCDTHDVCMQIFVFDRGCMEPNLQEKNH